jgi:predicted esterase
MSRSIWVLLLASLVPSLGLAQAERLELGKRLRKFEAAWEAQRDATIRKQAIPELQKAVTAFFSFRLAEAGRALDEARFQVQQRAELTEAHRWAESLHLKLDRYFASTQGGPISATLAEFYPTGLPKPQDVSARVSLVRADGQTAASHSIAVQELPQKLVLAFPEAKAGDYQLVLEVIAKERVLARSAWGLSLADDLDNRLSRLERPAGQAAENRTIESETLRALVSLLKGLASNRVPETDYPAARLLEEAEALAATTEPYYVASRPGQFWLSIPVEMGTSPVRLQVPPKLSRERPVPLVVALHGAGGSENLFFDGYGNGLVARLCQERGWLLVAPRVTGFAASSIQGIVAALSERYPVDARRVYLVGHSMGAGQALAAVTASPQRYAAVAALGGGNALRRTEGLQKVPFFIGVGDKDFALRGARALYDSLQKAQVKQVEFREYPDIEHLVIVQVALPDVFAFFDRVPEADPPGP